MTPARRNAVVLGVVAVAAAAARLAGVAVRPPWHDEYFTAWAAGLPVSGLISALRVDSGPPLPYLLAGLASLLGIPTLLAARLVSAAAGTAAVLVAARAARRIGGSEAGLWCAALLAVHPLAVAWSCEGRGYALLLLAGALAWERLEKVAASGRGATGLALAVALGCWSHALGLVVGGAVAVAALALPTSARRQALGGAAVGLASNLPWLPVAISQPPAATAWMSAPWAAAAPFDRLLAPVRLLPGVADYAEHLDLPSAPIAAQAAAAALGLLLLAAARPPRRLAALAAVPPVGLSVLAFAGLPYLFPGRSEAAYLAAVLGIVAVGAARSRSTRAWAALLCAGALASSAAGLAAWRSAPLSEDARVAAAIARALPDGGTIVVTGYWRLGVAYNLRTATARYPIINVPAEAAAHPGWYVDVPAAATAAEVDRLASDLVRSGTPRPEVAILVSHGLGSEASLTALARRLGLAPVLVRPEVTVWAPARDGAP